MDDPNENRGAVGVSISFMLFLSGVRACVVLPGAASAHPAHRANVTKEEGASGCRAGVAGAEVEQDGGHAGLGDDDGVEVAGVRVDHGHLVEAAVVIGPLPHRREVRFAQAAFAKWRAGQCSI